MGRARIVPRERSSRLDRTLRRPAGTASPSFAFSACSGFAARFRRGAACLLVAFALLPGVDEAQAQTSSVLVSSLGQTHSNDQVIRTSSVSARAQSFTTGGNAGGYRLTRADLDLASWNPATAVYIVTIRSDSSGAPGGIVGTLTNPASLPTSTLQTGSTGFAAPGGGIDLAAGATYWVVAEHISGASLGISLIGASPIQDAGAAAGWSMGIYKRFNNAWNTHVGNTLRIAIHGYAKTAPPPPDTRAPRVSGTPSVSGGTLGIVFDERLRSGSVPPPGAFEVIVDDGAGAHPAAVEIDRRGTQREVTLSLATSVPAGSTVKVRYTRPAARDERLRDRAGNSVAGFTRTVTNDSPAGQPVAAAGLDRTVDPGEAVMLDGSGSSDPGGDELVYSWTQVSGWAVTIAGADTATASFTVPERPGDRVFRLTVTDPGGLSAFDEVVVRVRDAAPGFGAARVPSLTLVPGEAMAPVVLPEATGGTGDLTYVLASDPAGLAGLSFDPATRTLSGTPEAVGQWVFTWRADDADDNRADTDAAVLNFPVTVEDPRQAQVRRSVRRTLATAGRRALSSALDNIGARFADQVPAGGLTLAGETVPLGLTGAEGTNRMERTWTCTPGYLNFPGIGGAGGHCAAGGWSRGMTLAELLGTSAFSLTLGPSSSASGLSGVSRMSGMSGADAPASGGTPGVLWSVWGRGEVGTFEGRPDGMHYEGELKTGWLGVDARSGPWVAGIALSHGTGEADYGYAAEGISGTGRLETTLTALYPYGRWTLSDGLEVRGVLGAGSGEATHRLDDGLRETSDLKMWMGSLGVRHALAPLAGIELALRGDASVTRMETGGGPDHVDNLTADSWRVRAGVEASRRIALDDDRALIPFAEAAARRDGGDGLEGTGLEVVGGIRYEAPRLQVEARGRWLASHTEEGAEESGMSVTARMGPGAHGRGLWLSLSPRWGAGTGSAESLWGEGLPEPAGTPQGDAAALEMRVGYGLGAAPYGLPGLVTPFAETVLSAGPGDDRRLRLGARFEASRLALGVELSGERVEAGGAGPEHALRLDLRLRF